MTTSKNGVDVLPIRQFWLDNVERLDQGCIGPMIMEGAYECGSVVGDYWERVEGLDQADILAAPPEFLRSLDEGQLLGCIAWHFRADHFDNYHFLDKETVYALQRIVRAWIEKTSALETKTVDSIVYVHEGCRLAGDDACDPKVTATVYLDGRVRISECLMSRKTGHAVKGTTVTKTVHLPQEMVAHLFGAIAESDCLVPNLVIYLPICDAISYVQFRCKGGPKALEINRFYDREADRFVSELFEILGDAAEMAGARLPL